MDAKRLYHPIQIGNIEIPGNLFLAPLAGITDKGFREICLREGADLTYTEMVSAEAVARGNEKTNRLMDRSPSEQLLAIQLFMDSPDTAERAVERVLTFNPTIIDLNCGCPVPKVIKTGAGSALMLDPERIRSIIQVLSKASEVPVTAKIRLGWDPGSINYLEAAQAAVEGGASLITMHARTRSQGYSGRADWQALADLKSNIPVPVIGSGDLMSAEDAKQMLEQTGIDGIMFARGAMGNPFIFSATRSLLTESTVPPPPSVEQRFATMIEQLDLTIADKGEKTACKEMRKQFCAYTKGLPNASALRNHIIHAQSRQDYLQVLSIDQHRSQW
jgi:nifR3 family TIM-barrel protein